MTRTRILALTAALTAAIGAQAAAQTKMAVQPASKVTIAGNSNVHRWACSSATFQASVELDSGYQTRALIDVPKPITKVVVDIPVNTLKCGNGKMDENMYKALRATELPDIRYVLSTL